MPQTKSSHSNVVKAGARLDDALKPVEVSATNSCATGDSRASSTATVTPPRKTKVTQADDAANDATRPKVAERARPLSSPQSLKVRQPGINTDAQLKALRQVEDRGKKRRLSTDALFEAAEHQAKAQRELLEQLRTDRQALIEQAEAERRKTSTHVQEQLGQLRQLVREDQKRSNEQLSEDVAKTLQAYDQWVGKMDERFTARLGEIETRFDQIKQRWTSMECKITAMIDSLASSLKQNSPNEKQPQATQPTTETDAPMPLPPGEALGSMPADNHFSATTLPSVSQFDLNLADQSADLPEPEERLARDEAPAVKVSPESSSSTDAVAQANLDALAFDQGKPATTLTASASSATSKPVPRPDQATAKLTQSKTTIKQATQQPRANYPKQRPEKKATQDQESQARPDIYLKVLRLMNDTGLSLPKPRKNDASKS